MRFERLYFIGVFLLLICFWVFTTGTYDDGDSTFHYLMSRYSWRHPELMLNHWGKPLFTILSSPFSQFGISGIKLFNFLIIFVSAIFVYKTGKIKRIKYPFLGVVLYLFATHTLLIMSSGLTEPLFGLFLVLGYYLMITGRVNLAYILISFILYSRSEGQIIWLLYFLYAIFSRHWKKIPLLFVGFVFFGIIGSLFHFNDFFWYFTQNPYSGGGYGDAHGSWKHYIVQYYYLTGIPFTILTIVGIGYWIWSFVKTPLLFHFNDRTKKTDLFFALWGQFWLFFRPCCVLDIWFIQLVWNAPSFNCFISVSSFGSIGRST